MAVGCLCFAFYLAGIGRKGWGWFLFAAILLAGK